jgi:hypothetical protein
MALAYRFDLTSRAASPPDKPGAPHQPPTLADIQKGIADAQKHWNIDGPQPTVVGNQGAYSVRLSPNQPGGLLGAAQVAWDAVRGVPLKLALYARGSTTPALELTVTDIKYGQLAGSEFAISPPADAKVVDVTGAGKPGAPAAPEKKGAADPKLSSLPFTLNAPASLGGRNKTDAKAVGHGGALVLYGKGPDTVAVFEQAAGPMEAAAPAKKSAGNGAPPIELPTVDIGGAKATELVTPLGGFIRFERGGISYTVAGSQPRDVLEAAARGL